MKRIMSSMLVTALIFAAVFGGGSGSVFAVETGEEHRVSVGEDIQAAIDQADPGDTILINEGTYPIDQKLSILKPLTITGEGEVVIDVSLNLGESNDFKHALGIYQNATINNLTINSNGNAYGVQVYQAEEVVLNNVTLTGSKGAGLTVNGSAVTANHFNTGNNAWGGVNADAGSGVADPTSFTLTGDGALTEPVQIWSDGINTTLTATVSVLADGFEEYYYTEHSRVWTNREPENAATITKKGKTYIFQTIQGAVFSAEEGDTITVLPGEYPEMNLAINTPGITLKSREGAEKTIISGGIEVKADHTVIEGFTFGDKEKIDGGFIGTEYSEGVAIRNNIVYGHRGTVAIGAAIGNETGSITIEGNRIHGGAIGLFPRKGSGVVILNNEIHGPVASEGIWIHGGQFADPEGYHLVISGNTYRKTDGTEADDITITFEPDTLNGMVETNFMYGALKMDNSGFEKINFAWMTGNPEDPGDHITISRLSSGQYFAGETLGFTISGLLPDRETKVGMPLRIEDGDDWKWALDEHVIDGMTEENGALFFIGTPDHEGNLRVEGVVQSGLPLSVVYITLSDYGHAIDNAMELQDENGMGVEVGRTVPVVTVTTKTEDGEETVTIEIEEGVSLKIGIEDLDGELEEASITLPKETITYLQEEEMSFEITSPYGSILLTKEEVALLDPSEALSFTIKPMDDQAVGTELLERMESIEALKEILDGKTIHARGIPVVIESSINGVPILLTFPITGELDEDAEYYVYVEHSDGENVLLGGELVDLGEGQKGIRITVEKFSTFMVIMLQDEPVDENETPAPGDDNDTPAPGDESDTTETDEEDADGADEEEKDLVEKAGVASPKTGDTGLLYYLLLFGIAGTVLIGAGIHKKWKQRTGR